MVESGAVRWPGGPATPCGAPACRCPACHRAGPSGSAPLTVTGIAPVRTKGRAAAPPVASARQFSAVYPLRLRGARGGRGCRYRQPGPPGAAVILGSAARRCRRCSRWVTPAEGGGGPGPFNGRGGAGRGRCCRGPGRPEAPAEREPSPLRPAAGLPGTARTR